MARLDERWAAPPGTRLAEDLAFVAARSDKGASHRTTCDIDLGKTVVYDAAATDQTITCDSLLVMFPSDHENQAWEAEVWLKLTH